MKKCCKKLRARCLSIIAREARIRERIDTKEMVMGAAALRWAAEEIKSLKDAPVKPERE